MMIMIQRWLVNLSFICLYINHCLGTNCGITDTHGCCISGGFFWCGSSGRCTYGDDVCEDGLGDTTECSLTTDSATFDLTPLTLQITELDHVVIDSNSVSGDTKTYIFNFCANAVTPDACVTTTGGKGEQFSEPSPAFQLYSDSAASGGETSGKYGGDISSECFRMGQSVSDSSATELSLYHGSDNEFGLSVTYTGGNTCDNGEGSRSLQVNVLCDNTQIEIPEYSVVTEALSDESCTYELNINSVYGCPLECPRNEETGEVCSNHGKCSTTSVLSNTQVDVIGCICDSEWDGDSCSEVIVLPDMDQNTGKTASSSSSTTSTASHSIIYKTINLFNGYLFKLFIIVILLVLGSMFILNEYLKKQRRDRLSRLADFHWVEGKQLLNEWEDEDNDSNSTFSNAFF